ncbi:MAG: DeoR/GlpR transcriptional regulator, partial [Anaerolineaceae bacterium]|nr:DeoR/GlpR transcriptional regulator [Anaerolineaceae bacterium]
GISIETVRRDLAALEEEGVIRRVYGGAVLADNNSAPNPIKPWSTRSILNNVEKMNIAKAMLDYIQDGMTVALDSGTTVLEIAKLFNERKNLTIITNDIHIASELSRNTDHTIYLIGGSLKKDDRITTGFLASEFLKNFSHIDAAILTCDGFLDGIGDFNVDMCALKKSMIETADKVYVALDHTKFSITPLYKVCGVKDLDLVITGNEAPPASVGALRQAGVQVILVSCV